MLCPTSDRRFVPKNEPALAGGRWPGGRVHWVYRSNHLNGAQVTGGRSVLRIEGFKHSNLKTGAPNERQAPISPLRQRLLENMNMRRFVPDTQREYIRAVKKLASFLGRSPDTATPEELRAFQLHLTWTGLQPQTINATGDDAPSCVRLRAAQAAARALARRGVAPARIRPRAQA